MTNPAKAEGGMMENESEGTLWYVSETIENEGFDYTFRRYSDFEGVSDAAFHALRKLYIAAADALEKYIKDGAKEPPDETH